MFASEKKGYREITSSRDINWCVKSDEGVVGESWYICCLADIAKAENPLITEAEFLNFCNDKGQDQGLIG